MLPWPPPRLGPILGALAGLGALCAALALGAILAYAFWRPARSTTSVSVPECSIDSASIAPAEGAPSDAQEPEEAPRSGSAPSTSAPLPALPADARFVYSFNAAGVLQETSRAAQSTSPFWFLDSGGRLLLDGTIGATIHGALPADDPWRIAYAKSNPRDTDDGTHPQNIFRMVTKTSWENVREELWLRIDADNFSQSSYRNASNGLLLMSRYRSSATLYYAGIRVDGTAVIKKKYEGTYYTLAQAPVFPGTYDSANEPDLLPHDSWLGLRVETQTASDGSVSVTLYLNRGAGWERLLSAKDAGEYGGTPPITGGGCLGIRTDFMDVSFRDFSAEELAAPGK